VSDLTFEQVRKGLELASLFKHEWQGIPVPIPEQPLVLHDRHPMADAFRKIDGMSMEVLVGGPDLNDKEYTDERIINHWYSRKLNADVYVCKATRREGPPRYFAVKWRRAPDRSMERLDLWLTTIGATDAWDLEAEGRARVKLKGLLSERQWRHYDLTGTFLETSPRSGLTYLFRRSRPTIALTPRWPEGGRCDTMKCLAVLCMHPVGYYQQTWAGCMVPSDDVIAHLLFMRGDEANYWKNCIQHEPSDPAAGL
jgi:hypothetical protein